MFYNHDIPSGTNLLYDKSYDRYTAWKCYECKYRSVYSVEYVIYACGIVLPAGFYDRCSQDTVIYDAAEMVYERNRKDAGRR